MPTKGALTRQRIIDLAGPIFNERGYHTTTLADLMAATGLEKGGIYNHFSSKEDLALAAYDRNAGVIASAIETNLGAVTTKNSVDRLSAVLAAFRTFAHDPPFPGGCPTLNTAVESHGSDPRLHERARQVVQDLLDTVARIVRRGQQHGEISRDVSARTVASVVTAGVEGALLLHQLRGDVRDVDHVLDHLEQYVRSLATKEFDR